MQKVSPTGNRPFRFEPVSRPIEREIPPAQENSKAGLLFVALLAVAAFALLDLCSQSMTLPAVAFRIDDVSRMLLGR